MNARIEALAEGTPVRLPLFPFRMYQQSPSKHSHKNHENDKNQRNTKNYDNHTEYENHKTQEKHESYENHRTIGAWELE